MWILLLLYLLNQIWFEKNTSNSPWMMEIVIVLMLNSGIVSRRVKRAYEMQTQYPAVHV